MEPYYSSFLCNIKIGVQCPTKDLLQVDTIPCPGILILSFSEAEDNFVIVSNNPYIPWKKVLLPMEPGDLEEVFLPKERDHFRNLNYLRSAEKT